MTNPHETIIAELYVDIGFGFNSEQVLTNTVLGNGKKLEFDLNPYQGINSLSFDPLKHHCVIHTNRISLSVKIERHM